jgi:uncharacterized protein
MMNDEPKHHTAIDKIGRRGLRSSFISHRSSFVLALLIAVASVVFTAPAAALEVPPAPTQWVTDTANILGGTEEDLLNKKLETFEQTSGAQFIIYTIPSLEGDSVEDFTIRAVERWKVGQKKYDNGLVLFVFVAEKKVRVEVGYGLEGTVTDAFSSRVIREQIAPHFQRNDYAGGLSAAADALITKIRTGEEPVPPLQQPGGAGQGEEEGIGVIPTLIILFVVFFVLLPIVSRSRRSGCGGCMIPIFPGGGGITLGGGGFGGGGFGGGGFGGGGGFSGGGGGFGGGGATGGW